MTRYIVSITFAESVRMKVLMIIAHPEYGGTETHVLSLCKTLRASGVQVGIATFGGPFVRHFRIQQIPVHPVDKTGRGSSHKVVADIVSIVRKHKYDVVHVHDIESFRLLPPLRKRLPHTPLVMTVHGMYYSKTEVRPAVSAATAVIAVSPAVRQWVFRAVGRKMKKVCWIPNGIDTQKYSPSNQGHYRRMLKLPQRDKVCLYAGRFQSDKWRIAQKFIMAAERIAHKNNNFTALLVGFGSRRRRLTQLAKQTNRRVGRAAVHVFPETIRMENFYRAATLVVGTGRVALEALSCGKPVIAVGVAGYEGIVAPATLNRMFASNFGDHAAKRTVSVNRLTNDIATLLTSADTAQRWGYHGRKVVRQRFSIQRVASMTRRAYANAKR